MKQHVCDVCNYSTHHITNFKNHLTSKNKCAPSDNPLIVSMIDRYFNKIKHNPLQCRKCTKIFKYRSSAYNHRKTCTVEVSSKDNPPYKFSDIETSVNDLNIKFEKLRTTVEQIEDNVVVLQKKETHECEAFYQKLLEKHLDGTHMHIETGITDVSNNILHAEIKHWKNYRLAVGQLLFYNAAEKRDILQVYFFGPCQNSDRDLVKKYMKTFNIQAFEFVHYNNDVVIVNIHTGDCVKTFQNAWKPKALE
jgi:hypothetical protein